MSDFTSKRYAVARLPRVCPECRVGLLPGQPYVQTAGRGPDGFFYATSCVPCDLLAERYVETMQGCGFLNDDEMTYPLGDLIRNAATFLWDDNRDFGKSDAAVRSALLAELAEVELSERTLRYEHARRAYQSVAQGVRTYLDRKMARGEMSDETRQVTELCRRAVTERPDLVPANPRSGNYLPMIRHVEGLAGRGKHPKFLIAKLVGQVCRGEI